MEPIENDELDPETAKGLMLILAHMEKLSKRETEICYACGKKVEKLEQHGRDVYAAPCGCRLWQGYVPAVWLDPSEQGVAQNPPVYPERMEKENRETLLASIMKKLSSYFKWRKE